MTFKKKGVFVSVVMSMVLAATCCAAVLPRLQGLEPNRPAANGIRNITSNLDLNAQDSFDEEVVRKLTDLVGDDERISLFATLDGDALIDGYLREQSEATAAEYLAGDLASARRDIRTEQNRFIKALKKAGFSYTLGERYDTLLNVVEFRVAAKDYRAAAAFGKQYGCELSLGEVYSEPQAEVVTNDVNVYGTGIFDSSESGYDGTGTVVAVLDSGFDYTHTAYQKMPSGLTLDMSDVAQKLPETRAAEITEGVTAADVYVSDKIPFAYDYADKDTDVYPLESSHGTHVAAIIAGSDAEITGVAPGAQLALMKVFRDVQDGAPSSAILSALEDCVTLGVDVINMSLGSAAGFTEDDKNLVNEVYGKVRDAGISLICAASNDYNSTYGSEKNGNLPLTRNPDSATVGSPSTYEAALSVASISGVKTPYLEWNGEPIYYTEASNSAGKEYKFMDMLLGEKQSARYDYVTISGPGRFGDYRGYDMTGKIALVRRGSITFEEKVSNARQAGAAGLIIYNNVSGDIRMSVGNDVGIPVISVSKESGDKLASLTAGTILVNQDNLAGPFMSDFSSWGPTPDLRIKPEITAHGGEIYSAIPGQRYDRMSGTSMASPNQAGVTTLVRQYVKEKFPSLQPLEVTAMVNQLMMSTTDIAFNPVNTPYSVRKQGAGLANLDHAVNTPAYLYVKDSLGNALDKTKLELGDDPEKTGIYDLKFSVRNISDRAVSYRAGAYVMTEGVAESLTDRKETTVTQNSYLLGDTQIFVTANGATVSDNIVTVPARGETEVVMTLWLTDVSKRYLDENFENGMYVEGFVRLESTEADGIDLDAPYLAFYGDWTQAPMFDLDIFETDPDAKNNAIDQEDKTMADAYSTTPIGGLNLDYINYLGSYYFKQDPDATQIAANRDHISLTNDTNGVNYIYAVWAGMLRGADHVDITITEKSTGRVIYSQTERKQQKSYNYGAAIIQSNIKIGFSAADYDLKNNTQYNVRLDGYLDYERDGKDTNKRNSFEFDFTTDFEAPIVEGVEYRSEYDKDTKKTKVFADIQVYDNHYAMAARLGRVIVENKTAILDTFGDYMLPIYGGRATTSVVTVELTDYLDEFRTAYQPNTFTVSLYDYAMNAAIYEIPLPDQVQGIRFRESGLTLSENETYVLNPAVYPDTEWAKTLEYESSDESVLRIVDDTVLAVGKGTAKITAKAADSSGFKTTATLDVTVLGPGDEGYRRFDPPTVQDFRLTGYETINAFYANYSSEMEIGNTGDQMSFGKRVELSMFPSEQVQLEYFLKSYFPQATSVKFSTSNPNVVAVTEQDAYVNGRLVSGGLVEARGKGAATIVATIYLNGEKTSYTARVSVTVKDPFITTGAYLTAYKGLGGVVEIPAKLNLTTISSYAFPLYNFVAKAPSEITEEDPYFTKQAPLSNNTITEVIIPEGVETIDEFAFANLKKLKSVTIPKSCRQINNSAFMGCTSLVKVNGLENVQIISENAFKNCTALTEVNLSSAVALGGGAFENTKLQKAELPLVQSAGAGAFKNCASLTEVKFAGKIKIADDIFYGCKNLKTVEINAPVVASGAFRSCTALQTVVLGKDVQVIAPSAFAGSRVARISVDADNPRMKASADGRGVLSKDGLELLAVVPNLTQTGYDGTYRVADGITRIGEGAFAGNTTVVKVELNQVQEIGERAFTGCTQLKEVEGTVGEIGAYAFSGCTQLVKLPALTGACDIGVSAFENTAVTEFTFAAGTAIPAGLFKNNTSLRSLVLGDNCEIGASAFEGCSALDAVTFGEAITIGERAFYNCEALASADLGAVLSVGAYAFGGDAAQIGSGAGAVTTYRTPTLANVDLSAAAFVGANAFANMRTLTEIKLPAVAARIGAGAFDGCASLATVALQGDTVEAVGDYAFRNTAITAFPFAGLREIGMGAFMNTAVTEADLANLAYVAEGAFYGAAQLAEVDFKSGALVDAYAFYNAASLAEARGLDGVTEIGAYAFSGDPIVDAEGKSIIGYKTPIFTEADLSAARFLGDFVFADGKLTSVKLSDRLEELGANPFSGCAIPEFSVIEINGFGVKETVDTYTISDTVKVIRGALYQTLPNGGLELVFYSPKSDRKTYAVEEGTYRIGDSAFFGAENLEIAELPYSLKAIGDSAFYDAKKLTRVNFGSIEAPILEAAFSASLHSSGFNFVTAGLVKYYSYTTDFDASNACYNSNFVSFVGLVDDLTMTYPKNGLGYTSFLYDRYFDQKIVTATVANDLTRAAVAAINAIPKNISLADEQTIAAARTAYNLVTDREQQGLVTNYSDLTKAENILAAIKGDPVDPEPEPVDKTDGANALRGAVIGLGVALGAAVLMLGGAAAYIVATRKKAKKPEQTDADAADSEENR